MHDLGDTRWRDPEEIRRSGRLESTTLDHLADVDISEERIFEFSASWRGKPRLKKALPLNGVIPMLRFSSPIPVLTILLPQTPAAWGACSNLNPH